jgi:site-specific recombinase
VNDDGAAISFDDPDLIGPPSDEMPDRAEFLRLIEAGDNRATALLRILLARCKPDAPLPEQLVAIEQLGRFVVAGPSVAGARTGTGTGDPYRSVPGAPVPGSVGHSALVRLELVVTAIERVPAARRRFRASLRAVMDATRGIKLFGEIGLPNERGLLAETTDRMARRFLPEPPALHELWMLAGRIFRSLDDLAWLGPAADPLLHRLAAAGGDAWSPLRSSVLDAMGLIATRIAALGMAEPLRIRTTDQIRESPLYLLTRAQPAEMPPLIAGARRHIEQIRVALEEHGVSVDVVYSLDAIERGLARLELLLPFADPHDDIAPTYEIRALLAAVGRGLVGGRSFTQLLADNLRLLARKVIERAGRTGEHYVTSSRREYWKMLGSAFGGGVLTLGTAVGKFLVKWGHFPLFIDGLLSSVVYAGSFVVMQLIGFTLATKQPSMTAAALAGTIRDRAGPGRLDELVRLIARIARSQFAAAIGNVTGVIVTSIAFDTLWRNLVGHSFLDHATSIGVVDSFHPFATGTIFFAAITGVILWLSSLVAGWFENWVVYRRIPEAIEHHRYGKRFGKARMARLARFIEQQAAGFGGSVSLGFFLGMVPVFAKFVGLPIDVRHITLSTGSLTLAIQSIGLDGLGWAPIIWAAVGIVFIGILNFGVSFALALVVALRARDVPTGERRMLPGAVVRRFFRKPLEFFYPPREVPGVDQTGQHPTTGHH